MGLNNQPNELWTASYDVTPISVTKTDTHILKNGGMLLVRRDDAIYTSDTDTIDVANAVLE